MDRIETLKQTLKQIMAPTKELAHGTETLQWLLKINPESDWQVQIAAFAHDIERAVNEEANRFPPRPKKEDHVTYDSYKQEHARRSAEVVERIMEEHGFDVSDIQRVCSAIEKHEVGGDKDSDLVRDADSIRWFDKGYIKYIERSGINGAKEKGWWMYKRANEKTKELIFNLEFDDNVKQFIKNNVKGFPYRKSIYGLIIEEEKLLMVHKVNSNMWDLPGGGIDPGETLHEAITRELQEELNIRDFDILHISETTNKYDWPDSEIEKNFKKNGINQRGQEQHFAIIKLKQRGKAIQLQEEELKTYKWVPLSKLKEYIGYEDEWEVIDQVLKEYF